MVQRIIKRKTVLKKTKILLKINGGKNGRISQTTPTATETAISAHNSY